MSASPLDAARALGPTLRAAAPEAERGRRLPPAVVTALRDAGLFRLCVPRALGGLEAEPAAIAATLAALAEADGAAAWCAMIALTSAVLSAYLPEEVGRAIWAERPEPVLGGVFAPHGRAVAVDGGYRVSGRWPFASGCQHCTWLMGGCLILDGGRPRLLPTGTPDARLALFPASDVSIIDTWSVSGLRGTGSHDIAVDGLLVPAERTASLVTDRPWPAGPLYRFPVFGFLAVAVASVAVGIARGAIEEIVRLAAEKTPTTAQRPLRERPMFQLRLAEAEAALGGARGFLDDAVADAWALASRGDTVPLAVRARLRIAATAATAGAARAVDLAYETGGGTSIYDSSPLQRAFRDVHAITQHILVAAPSFEFAGRALVGVPMDTSML